jgi:hypothetical protein
VHLEHVEPRHAAVSEPGATADAGPAMDSEQLLASLSRRLDDYSAGLSEREQQLLGLLLRRAMTPLDRIRAGDGATLLSPDEERLLREIEERDIGG